VSADTLALTAAETLGNSKLVGEHYKKETRQKVNFAA
jgi:hypothetical protein